MADFTSNTQLSAPQGAGTQPIAAVKQLDPTAGVAAGLTNIFSAVGKGIEEMNKAKAAEQQNAVLQQYAQAKSRIIDSDKSPSEKSARLYALSREYLASNPALTKEIAEVSKAFRDNTEQGVIEDQAKAQRDQRKTDIASASAKGYVFYPGMDPVLEDKQIDSYKTETRTATEFSRTVAQNAEARAQRKENAEVQEAVSKQQAQAVLVEMGGRNYDLFRGLISDLSSQVKSGKMPFEQAQMLLNERFSRISAGIAAASVGNEAMANPFRDVFQKDYDLGLKLLNPQTYSDAVKAQFDAKINTASLMLLNKDPNMVSYVAADRMFQGNASVALAVANNVTGIIMKLAQTPSDSVGAGSLPPVIGDPQEAVILETIKGAVKSIGTGDKNDNVQKELQASNSVNTILKQISKQIDTGMPPEKLVGFTKFIASSEYAVLVNSGKIDREAAQAARKVWELSYERNIVKGVQDKLSGYLFDPRTKEGVALPQARIESKDAFDIRFNGAGITIDATKLYELNKNAPYPQEIEFQRQRKLLADLKLTERAVTQVIQAGAHIEGSTDYKRYWEENKHRLMPNIFPAPVSKETPNMGVSNDKRPTKTTPSGGTSSTSSSGQSAIDILNQLESLK